MFATQFKEAMQLARELLAEMRELVTLLRERERS